MPNKKKYATLLIIVPQDETNSYVTYTMMGRSENIQYLLVVMTIPLYIYIQIRTSFHLYLYSDEYELLNPPKDGTESD